MGRIEITHTYCTQRTIKSTRNTESNNDKWHFKHVKWNNKKITKSYLFFKLKLIVIKPKALSSALQPKKSL